MPSAPPTADSFLPVNKMDVDELIDSARPKTKPMPVVPDDNDSDVDAPTPNSSLPSTPTL